MKQNINPNAQSFYSKMNRIKGQAQAQQRTDTQQQLRSILRSAIKQVDGLKYQDKRALVIRDVLGDLLTFEAPQQQMDPKS